VFKSDTFDECQRLCFQVLKENFLIDFLKAEKARIF